MDIASFPSYVTGLIDSGTTGAYISLGILGFIAFMALSGLLFGLSRGFGKSTVRLITIIASAVVSFFAVTMIGGAVSDFFDGKTLEEVIRQVYPDYSSLSSDVKNLVASIDVATAELVILLLVGLIVAPIAFIAVFIVLNALFMIIYWIFSGILGFTGYRKGFFSTLLGGAVGIVQGVFIAAVILVPVAGTVGAVNDLYTAATDERAPAAVRDGADSLYDALYLEDIMENPALSLINTYGGGFVYSKLTTVNFEGTDICMRDEISSVSRILLDTTELSGFSPKNPSEDHKEALTGLVDSLGNDPFLSELLAGILRTASNAVHNEVIGIPIGDPYKTIIKDTTYIFHNTTRVTLITDVDTLLDVYFILADAGVIDAFGDGPDSIPDLLIAKYGDTEFTVIDTVIKKLRENERTAIMVDSLTQLSLAVLCESIGLDEDAKELYDSVKGDVGNILTSNADYSTKEEYQSAVTTNLNETFLAHDIELEEDIIADMSSFVADKYYGKEDITDEDINDAILSYYNAYAEKNGKDSLPDIDDLPVS